MKNFIKLIAFLLGSFMLFSMVSCHPERRVMGNPELFREVGEQWVEFHPCYTEPSVIIVRGDTLVQIQTNTDTIIHYDSIHHSTEKIVYKTITKDRWRVDSIMVSKPDLRLQNQLKEQLVECKIHQSNAIKEATDWKNTTVKSWIIGGFIILLLLMLLIRPKFL